MNYREHIKFLMNGGIHSADLVTLYVDNDERASWYFDDDDDDDDINVSTDNLIEQIEKINAPKVHIIGSRAGQGNKLTEELIIDFEKDNYVWIDHIASKSITD